jgi:hypothetical protein
MARTPEQIEQELDEWRNWRTEQTAALSGLTESLTNLQVLAQEGGTSAERAARITRLAKLETDLEATRAELSAANQVITRLETALATPPGPQPPAPSPTPPPNPPPSNGGDPPTPPEPRRTRTGIAFL